MFGVRGGGLYGCRCSGFLRSVVCDSGLLVRVESADEKKREKKKTALVNKKEKKKGNNTKDRQT